MRHCVWTERERISMALFDASIELEFSIPGFKLTKEEVALSNELDVVARAEAADHETEQKRARNRAWYERHREAKLAQSAQWAKDHPERRSEIRRANYLKNRERRLAYQAAYRARKKQERMKSIDLSGQCGHDPDVPVGR